jgi:threonine dehydrogenase-like Zn-dependent dehydrogenase
MGIRKGGKMAILAGTGPMGLGAIDYALHCDRRPSLIVVTDIDEKRLSRASSLFTPENAEKEGVKLMFVNTSAVKDASAHMKSLTDDKGFDDVFVFAPVKEVVEQADSILAFDGCLNFFAGPGKTDFRADINFYNVHYSFTHILGTSGGNTNDMIESLEMMSSGKINPAVMITHVGGLDAVIDTTLRLPRIPGGKKLIYTNVSMPLTALTDLEKLGEVNAFYKGLHEIVAANNYIWNIQAERYLLANSVSI